MWSMLRVNGEVKLNMVEKTCCDICGKEFECPTNYYVVEVRRVQLAWALGQKGLIPIPSLDSEKHICIECLDGFLSSKKKGTD